MINKIIIIYLIYGTKNYEAGLTKLKEITTKMFNSLEPIWIIVDNSSSVVERNEKSLHYIHGDNMYFEFTGWDKGIEYVKKNFTIDDSTMFLFANDTFFRRKYSDSENFLDEFTSKLIKNKDLKNSAIGFLDDFPKNVILDDIVYKQWIRSNIFFLPYNVLNSVYPLTFPFKEDEIFSRDIDSFWSSNHLISENWKAYISSWLFGEENKNYPEYSLKWLKSEPLTLKNKSFFKKKAISILSEHYLTARLFKLKIPIINTNIFQQDPMRHIKPYYKEDTK